MNTVFIIKISGNLVQEYLGRYLAHINRNPDSNCNWRDPKNTRFTTTASNALWLKEDEVPEIVDLLKNFATANGWSKSQFFWEVFELTINIIDESPISLKLSSS